MVKVRQGAEPIGRGPGWQSTTIPFVSSVCYTCTCILVYQTLNYYSYYYCEMPNF